MQNIPIRHIKVTQKEPNFCESFSIRDLRDFLGGRDLVQELHRHDFFYILALKKGIGTHEIDFTAFEVCDNSVFFMRPGQVHQHTLKGGSVGYLMAFKTNFYYPDDRESNQLLRKATSRNYYHFAANKYKNIHSILTSIFQEYTDKQEGYQKVIQANLGIFFIELVRQNRISILNSANTYAQQRLDELVELLETQIVTYKKVSQYAKLLNLSSYQLNAITKQTLGKTCSELINEYIILESKRYLRATANQVNQIAYHLGYEDASYFIRFFKKHTAYSPEAFRYKFR
jgi:AraC family transcriptional regulator, transcriptional activator of pobA